MNNRWIVPLLVVLVALALIGRCDVRRAAGQVPHVTQTRQSHAVVDPLRPPGDGSALSIQPGPGTRRKEVSIMAWRPTRHLIEGEIDNTLSGKITGWLQFARMKDKVILDLTGNFHRDIRGTRIYLCGGGCLEGAAYMRGFSPRQTGKAGDMTAGFPPRDYGYEPYFEWYSEQNGRVLLAPALHQLWMYGRPLPASECEPISRQEQDKNYAEFLRQAARHSRTAAVVIAMASQVPSDPAFSHWVIVDDRIVGEAHNVQPDVNGYSSAYIQWFDQPGHVLYEHIETDRLRGKNVARWIA